MGLIDLRTDLKSLKYGSMPLGSDKPYITKDINNPPSSNQIGMQITKRVDDLSRIAQMLVDKPGLKYLGSEALLQQISNIDKVSKASNKGKAVLDAVKSTIVDTGKIALSTLAQVPVNGTGTHFLKGFRTDTYLKPTNPGNTNAFTRFFGAGGVEGAQYALRGEEVPGTRKSEFYTEGRSDADVDSKFDYDENINKRIPNANNGTYSKQGTKIISDYQGQEMWKPYSSTSVTSSIYDVQNDTLRKESDYDYNEKLNKPLTEEDKTGQAKLLASDGKNVKTTVTGSFTTQTTFGGITLLAKPTTLGYDAKVLPGEIETENTPQSAEKLATDKSNAQAGAPVPVGISGSRETTIIKGNLPGSLATNIAGNALPGTVNTELTNTYSDGTKSKTGKSTVSNVGNALTGSAIVTGPQQTTPKPGDLGKYSTSVVGSALPGTVDRGLDKSYSDGANSKTGTSTVNNVGSVLRNSKIAEPKDQAPSTVGGVSNNIGGTYEGPSGLRKISDFRSGSAYVKGSGINYTKQNMESRITIGRQGKDRSGDRYQSVDKQTVDSLNALPIGTKRQDATKEARDLAKFFFEIITPDNSRFIHFRAYIDSIDDSYTADWQGHKYVGRAENFLTYGGFDRDVNISFKIAAMSRSELKPLYQKMVYLASTTAPTYSDTFMRGTVVKLSVGSYFVQQPGVITSVKYSLVQDMPWEIAMQGPEGGETDVQELPMGLQCSVSFKPIHNFAPQTGLFNYFTSDVNEIKFFEPTEHVNIK